MTSLPPDPVADTPGDPDANPDALGNFCAFFNNLDKTCTDKLYNVYTQEIVFRDPLHHIEGREALEAYFATMYSNVTRCDFTYHTRQQQGKYAFVTWTMLFEHPRLKGGQPIEVAGCSALTFDQTGLVSEHRDYFDAGALLYEHLPVMGRVIRWLKRRLG